MLQSQCSRLHWFRWCYVHLEESKSSISLHLHYHTAAFICFQTTLFHEILLNGDDGAMLSMVGIHSSDLEDVELVYLHRHNPSHSPLHNPAVQEQPFPDILSLGKKKRFMFPPLTASPSVLYTLTTFQR